MSAASTMVDRMLCYEALADKEGAKLALHLLRKEGVGVGEHSTDDYRADARKALDALVDARDRLLAMKEEYGVEAPSWGPQP